MNAFEPLFNRIKRALDGIKNNRPVIQNGVFHRENGNRIKKAKAKPGKIFIGGLKADMTEEMIRSAFEAYGTVTEIELPVDKKDNNKRKVS